ncbi:LOW QUALITY PROTEIN: olfactory receptor 6C65-like [Zootoca vivipara]|uniref:LOW QUALITY PROTEIN: olfactory receptor 6C65-like n=1 Tax=Zootoca vivipara TaxID=8524 RepID=UPI00293BDE25|nr:LOW QUALITY PROTEIN: olfactory receptor 6C65-like [Zootoca vivipara]
MDNQTKINEFILLGFTENGKLEIFFFVLFLIMYLMAVMGNMIIITITLMDFHLKTPMYFFLRNYAILEIGYTTAAVPKALFNLASGRKTISYVGCLSQSFFYFFLGTTDFFLLTVMSFDRYVAICNPLRYTTIMNEKFCTFLVLFSWIGSLAVILVQSMLFIQFPFCNSNIIDHFFCDSKPLLRLLCGDTQFLELSSFILSVFTLLGTLAITVVSYVNIISTVLHIPTAAGRQKAFSTCAAHITVVTVTYGSCITMYIIPERDGGQNFNKVVAVLNNVVCPLMTPFVYSLRNRQVQDALKNAFACNHVFNKMQRN